MATNKKIQEKKIKKDASQQTKDARFLSFHRNFSAMKNRQGWNYQKPGV